MARRIPNPLWPRAFILMSPTEFSVIARPATLFEHWQIKATAVKDARKATRSVNRSRIKKHVSFTPESSAHISPRIDRRARSAGPPARRRWRIA